MICGAAVPPNRTQVTPVDTSGKDLSDGPLAIWQANLMSQESLPPPLYLAGCIRITPAPAPVALNPPKLTQR